MFEQPDEAPKVTSEDDTDVWIKRIEAAIELKKAWEADYRVKECYQYWRGNQRENPMDGAERRAMHNKIHPEVAETLPSLYFYAPYGRVVASPERADTPGETVSEKARLLQDTGLHLVRDKATGFKDNTHLPIKEGQWAIGCVEVGYDPDFINNPAARRPPLKEKKDTKIEVAPGDYPEAPDLEAGKDAMGLTVGPGSSLEELTAELKRLRENLKSETFFVKHIPANQLLISVSDKPILGDNDWVGYWQDYSLEDIKASPAYENTEDLKAEGDLIAKEQDGSVDRVRLYRIWDLRTLNKMVFAKGHKKRLMKKPFVRCALKFYRPDIDPYHFFPIPPVFLKLNSQDQYNDSAEYLRKMRIATVPRYTYDEDAITADEAAKFQSREMNIMIPRKANTHGPIEPVNQPSTAAAAIQTLALSEKEFTQASKASGNPLDPPNQTATRAVMANAKASAQDSAGRSTVATFLSEIIEELILLAVENMNLTRWIAINVDMDSHLAMEAAMQVKLTYDHITAERLRSAVTGINWHIEIEADTLSPVSEAEKGMKLMQMLNFVSTPQGAALMSRAPKILKRLMSLAGLKSGEDVDAIHQALGVIVQMNMQAQSAGVTVPGVSPTAGEPSPNAAPTPPPPDEPAPIPAGVAGA